MALPANALMVVATLELELGLTASASAAQTALLERLIGVVSDGIERYCGRKFYREVIVDERVAGYASRRLVVGRTPVVSVQAVKLEGQTIGTSETIAATEYYIENPEAGFIVRKSGWENTAAIGSGVQPHSLPGTEEKAYLVSYTGGYILTGATRTLPYDLEQAAIIAAVSTYRGRGKYQRAAEQSEEGGAQLWYDYVLPPNARQLLNPYRRLTR